jgi:hypothetical protein
MSRHEKLLDRLRDPQRDASWRVRQARKVLQKNLLL